MLTIYSKKNCPFCVQAANLLRSKNINFTEIKVDEDFEAREFILREGHRTVPQIYLGDKLFVEGGFTGLSKLSEDQLRDKLNASKQTV